MEVVFVAVGCHTIQGNIRGILPNMIRLSPNTHQLNVGRCTKENNAGNDEPIVSKLLVSRFEFLIFSLP